MKLEEQRDWTGGEAFCLGPVLVEPRSNTLIHKGKRQSLEPKAMQVLLCLVGQYPRDAGKTHLLAEVWPQTHVGDQVLKVAVSQIRKALGDQARNPRFIQTVSGGYRLICEPVAACDKGKRRWADRPTRHLLTACLITLLLTLVLLWQWPQPKADPQRLAILPFEVVSDEEGQDFLGHAMSRNLMGPLIRSESWHVVSTNSVRAWSQSGDPPAKLVQVFGLTYLLEGSVILRRGQIQVTVLWTDEQGLIRHSQEVKGKAADLFTIITGLQQQLYDGSCPITLLPPSTPVPPKVNNPAMVAYLRGMRLWDRQTGEQVREAHQRFQEALRLEPEFADAHLGLAETYLFQTGAALGLTRVEAYERARSHVETALRFNPHLARAHAVLGSIKFSFSWQWSKARAYFEEAHRLSPADPDVNRPYAEFLAARGQGDLACQIMRDVYANDQLSVRTALTYAFLLFQAKRYGEARRAVDQVLADQPQNSGALWLQFDIDSLRGKHAEAMEAYAKALRVEDLPTDLLRSFDQAASQGITAVHRWRLAHAEAIMARVSPAWRAMVHMALGEEDQVYPLLKTALAQRDAWVPWLFNDPRFEPLKNEPRFQQLMAGLEELDMDSP